MKNKELFNRKKGKKKGFDSVGNEKEEEKLKGKRSTERMRESFYRFFCYDLNFDTFYKKN